MITIEQLKKELSQKINELNESRNSQYFLRETLKKNTKTMEEIESQLKGIVVFLKYSNECIYKLTQENAKLKSSCDVWMKRAIKLEFELLSARDRTKE